MFNPITKIAEVSRYKISDMGVDLIHNFMSNPKMNYILIFTLFFQIPFKVDNSAFFSITYSSQFILS